MRVTIADSPEEFATRTGDLLAGRIEHNLLATVLEHFRFRPSRARALFAHVCDAEGTVVAAALRTPPWRMLASVMDAATADALLAAWLPRDPSLPGVGAPREVARALGCAWKQRTGGVSTLATALALHTLEDVSAPARPAPGRLRVAGASDRELMVRWMREFAVEAGIGDGALAPELVGRGIDLGALHVWDDGGPVSLAGTQPAIAGVVRVGPVYTPPAHRSRGYASSAVAAVSRAALDAGARRCALYTDLANPTSNRIYAALGYRRVLEWDELDFTRRSEEAPNPPPS
ncbi:MAG TPA: GNAT family N-acetyltransferase [Solirubrobacteraceae bacterium]|nr:GNAT family N-acetyltransferase [Solirubrobacteraceae bacterium]